MSTHRSRLCFIITTDVIRLLGWLLFSVDYNNNNIIKDFI